MRCILSVLVCAVWLFAYFAEAQQTCRYYRYMNITAEDLEPPAFSASTYSCCSTCSSTTGCVAAVFSNNLCYLKRADHPTQQSFTGTVIFVNAPPTPQPTTTPVPPPATPLPTAAPPSPMTPTPNTNGSVILYRTVTCDQSSRCSAVQDNSCVTRVYFSDVCYDRRRFTCMAESRVVRTQWYREDQCRGLPSRNKIEPTDVCEGHPQNGTFSGTYCDYSPQPAVTGARYVMSNCGSYACGTPQCSPTKGITGQCVQNPEGPSGAAGSAMYYCWPHITTENDPHYGASGYITVASYSTSDCSGTPNITAVPLGVCYRDINFQNRFNSCESP